MTKIEKRLSLENLIESEDAGLEILHPGRLEITRELAELCHIGKDTSVLDVASGTGESAFYLAQNFGCRVIGIDISDYMIVRAKKKAIEKGIIIEFKKGDAHGGYTGNDLTAFAKQLGVTQLFLLPVHLYHLLNVCGTIPKSSDF